jgi:hypothetical protein
MTGDHTRSNPSHANRASRLVPKALALALACALVPIAHSADSQSSSIEQRLKSLEERQTQLEREVMERDARIKQLEAENLPTTSTPSGATNAEVATKPSATKSASAANTYSPTSDTTPQPAFGLGRYQFGTGLVLARGDLGELDFGLTTYVRYLNQMDLEETYTDSFGRTSTIDRREEIQLNKVSLNFKGWMFDEAFRYLLFIWTANATQGQSAQVAVAGFLSYNFNEHFTLAGGVGALPSTRSTMYTYPNWLRVDNRTVADEFFRGSYTNGIWAQGEIANNLYYRAMVGQNLSILGVDAGQLSSGLNTYSGSLWWMPTTGEYGPAMGWGDFEEHRNLATLFGASYTRSREDAESQPNVNAFENSQLKLSDGTRLFQPNAFNTGGQILEATTQMFSMNAGMKYRGWSFDAEYYRRRIDHFSSTGIIPVDELNDSGFQVQASVMAIPQTLQVYASGSKIFGEYGDPYDGALGMNWFPFKRREVRANLQGLYLNRSPVGYLSVPFALGGTGWVFTTDFVFAF